MIKVFNMKKLSVLSAGILLSCTFSSATAAQNSITVWEDLNKAKGLEIAAKDFERDYDCKVLLVEKDSIKQFKEVLKLSNNGMPVPDVFILLSDKVGEAIDKKVISDIPVMHTEKNRYLTSSVKDFIENNKIYAVPRSIESLVIFYNKDIIKEPIETMSGYEILAKERQKEGKYGLIGKLNNLYYSYGFLSGYGSYIFGINKDGTVNTDDIGLNNDGAVKGMKLVADYTRNYIPKTAIDKENGLKTIDEMFINGQAAAVINGPWAADKYKKAGVNYDVTSMPKLSNGMRVNPFCGNKGYAISKKSKNKQLAAQFLVYANQPRYAMFRYQRTSELPPVKELLSNPLVLQDKLATSISNQSVNTVSMPSVKKMNDVWKYMERALNEAIADENADVKAIADKAVQKIKD